MCGIAGILCNRIGENEINEALKMRNMLKHRGPNDEGIWISDNREAVLVHCRLSILDLSDAGKQPMIAERNRYVMSYNGEIYNYKELAFKLQQERKASFVGTSDTEVLLRCFEEYGIDKTLALCRGMFAIALYDRQERKLVLARDRMGEKPLYYGYINNAFAFASELSCLEKLSYTELPLDYCALNEFIGRGFITGKKTIYEKIYKLRPGEMVCINSNMNIAYQRFYWNYKGTILLGKYLYAALSLEDASLQLERMLTDAISKQMVSDVPVGAFLSSGIDSSLIVAIMQKLSIDKIKTFSIGIEDCKMNEANESKEIAKHLGTDHTELYITEQDVKEVIPILPEIYSEPFGDPSAIPSLLVSKLAKTRVSVALTGDGGDELFGGYPWYQHNFLPKEWKIMRKIPFQLRRSLCKRIMQSPWCISHTKIAKHGEWFQANSIEALYDIMRYGILSLPENEWCIYGKNKNKDDVCTEGFKNTSEIMMYLDAISYLPDDVLVKMDRASMRCSLETRTPFLDKEIVQFAGGISIKNKISKKNESKIILREILYKYVPQHLVSSQKKGFSIPITRWLVEDKKMNEWANALMDSRRIKQEGILNSDKVEKVWRDFVRYGKYSVQIWNLLMFEAWYESRRVLSA